MTRCLVVDDSPADRSTMEMLLSSYGFELDSMEDAEAALARCRARMPDVLLLSGRVGAMDAVAFMRRLGKPMSRRPVVLVYGDAGAPEDVGRVIWEGASACLLKPFDAEILDLKLRQAGVV